jgi:hypothetical protein
VSDFVDLDTFQQENARADVRFVVGGEPYFVVDELLLQDEAGAFLKIGKQAAAYFYVADEIGFETGDIVGLFVDPDHSGQLLDDFFFEFMRFEIGIGLEVEDQDILAAESFSAGIHELRDAQKNLDARIVGI